MAKAKPQSNPFIGLWRIVSMSGWDEAVIHEESPAYIEFDERESGEFHFCYVEGYLDCQLGHRDGQPIIEWTWDGNDEMDQVHGRGWAVLKGAELHGMIFFHQGDESDLVAKKARTSKRAKTK